MEILMDALAIRMEPHGQSPCLHAEVPAFAKTSCAGVSARRRGLLRSRIKYIEEERQGSNDAIPT